MTDERDAVVLVVDDEEMVADMFSLQLEQTFTVRTAYSGEAALEAIDEDVDVVLLDRRMPGLSGDDVLCEIRAEEYDCRVIMVTAVDTDFDILGMPCDAYIEKPVDGDDLHDVVQLQLDIREYDERISDLYAICSKLAVLEAELPATLLEQNQEYREVRARRDALRWEVDDLVDDLVEEIEVFELL